MEVGPQVEELMRQQLLLEVEAPWELEGSGTSSEGVKQVSQGGPVRAGLPQQVEVSPEGRLVRAL